MTAPMVASTNGSEVSAASALTQSAGRLKVGMPTATLARPGAGIGAYQPALCTVVFDSVVMSNQIQPPSSNASRPISNSRLAGSFEIGPANGGPPTAEPGPVG